ATRARAFHGSGSAEALSTTNAAPNPIAINGGSRVATKDVSPWDLPVARGSGRADRRERSRVVRALNPRRITRQAERWSVVRGAAAERTAISARARVGTLPAPRACPALGHRPANSWATGSFPGVY